MDGLFAEVAYPANKPLGAEAPATKMVSETPGLRQTNGVSEPMMMSNHVVTSNHMAETPKAATPEVKKDKHHSSSSHKHSSSSSKHHSSGSKHHSSGSSKHHSSSGASSKDPSKHHSSSSSKDPSKHHSSSSSKDPSKHHSSSSSKDPSKHHSSSSSKDPSKHQSSSSSKHSSSSSSKHHSSSSSSKHSSSSSKDKHSSSSSKDPSKHSSSSHKHSSSSSSQDPTKHSSSSSSKHSSSKHSGSSSSSKHSSSHSSSSSHKHKDGSSKHHSSSSSGKHHSSSSHRPKESASSDAAKLTNADGMTPPPVAPKPLKLSIKVESPKKNELKREIKEERFSPRKMEEQSVLPSHVKVKEETMEVDSDDDAPLSARKEAAKQKSLKRPLDLSDDEDDAPLTDRIKIKKEAVNRKRKHDDDADFMVEAKKKKKEKKVKQEVQSSPTKSPSKKAKKMQDEDTKWRWWEDDKKEDGVKWRTLEHKGPVFAAPYIPLPSNVRFYYNGKVMKLTEATEEVGTFYGRMIEHDYCTKEVFNKNFMKDWRKVMTPEERTLITDLSKCNFNEINEHFKRESEAKKNRSKEEKQQQKEENAALQEEYGFCIIDGHKQKIGNFRIEPPGLFRGRGEHPKQGMLKRRTQPEDVIINCSKGARVPEPPEGHKWKEVRHDNTVTWLACWTENIQGSTKYVMLNAASKLKGEKDWQKYETARKLHKIAHKIRATYHDDFKSKEMRVRQRAVAMYFIDKLALRAGNEKDEDQADTVGCCSLRVEHLKLHETMDGKDYMVEFDFLGKDSIRYYNKVQVEKRVFKNLQLFMENKSDGDDLFDRLNTAILNKHLAGLMEGLTAKVFRTYNASKTLQEQLALLTRPDDPVAAKLLSYNRANRAVAVLCNHQRAAPKNFGQQMERLQEKIDAKKEAIRLAKKEVKACKSDLKHKDTNNNKKILNRKKAAVARLQEQLIKLEVQQTDKDENKEIALGTSKLNYLDPRISVAWCKKWDVPVEKIYNKTQREKFAWAIDMADEDFEF